VPQVNNQGVQIHFQETGNGSPLVLQHGFNSSLMEWYEFGYAEKLQDKYRK